MSILGLVLARAAIGIGRITTRSSLKPAALPLTRKVRKQHLIPLSLTRRSECIAGGSFLCNDQYCSRYIVGTRGKGEVNTGTNHLGFRCVKSAELLARK
jgi:hypothetical protein